jgi:ABC-type lipoprotein release transport system permease subunit
MGRLLLVGRLALKDLRHRPTQALLLLLAIAAGAATLTLGLSLRGTTNSPYARTRAATAGPDVVATLFPGGGLNVSGPPVTAKPGRPSAAGTGGSSGAGPSVLLPLERAAGVTASSGPFPVTWTLLNQGGTTGSAEVEGRNSALSSVDRPELTQGTWVRPGGVVVEAAFANALGLHVGNEVKLGGASFRVVGTAVTAAVPAYPDVCGRPIGCFLVGRVSSHDPGLVWATEADANRVAGTSGPVAYVLNLKLNDPARAITFTNRYDNNPSSAAPTLYPWQDIRDGDAQVLAKVQKVLLLGSWLLALLAIASVAVLVGGRMAEQTRRVGLLKAVGGTPRFVAVVLMFEHMVVGVGAAIVGLLVGWLAAPLIDRPGAGLLGAPSAPALTGTTVALVVAVALAVAIVATFVPALRAARQSTVAALEDSARAPRRSTAMISLSAHLPPPLLIGVRLAVRRPRRLLLSVFSVAVTTSGLVAVLIVHATASNWSVGTQVAEATTIISVMLIVLAAVNAIFIAWTTALETRHPAALSRALGATPKQITTGLSAAFLPPALFGALLGIPGGIGIYDGARKGDGPMTLPPALWLGAMVILTVLVIAVLTAIPTRIGARRPVAEVLQAEAA